MGTFSNEVNRRLDTRVGPQQKLDPRAIKVQIDQIIDARERSAKINRVEQAKQRKSVNEASPSNVEGFSQDAVDTILDASKDDGGFSVGGFFKSLKNPVVRGLDILSRPSYSLLEGMKEASESRNEGQNVLESAPEIIGGLWSGLSGKEKTDYSDVLAENAKFDGNKWTDPLSLISQGIPVTSDLPFEAANALVDLLPGESPEAVTNVLRQNPLNPTTAGTGLNELNEVSPVGAQVYSGAAGLAGTVAYDPLNAVGGKVAAKVFSQAGELTNFSEEAIKARTSATAMQYLNDVGLGATFGKKGTARFLTPDLPVGKSWMTDAISEGVDNAYIRINEGATAGRVRGIETAPYTIAESTTEAARSYVFKALDDAFSRISLHFTGTQVLTGPQLKMLAKDPIIDKLFETIYKGNLHKATGLTKIDDILDLTKVKNISSTERLRIVRESLATVKDEYDKVFKDLRDTLYDDLYGSVHNVPGIRVFGREAATFPRIGKAYAKFKSDHLESAALKNLSHAKLFPGRLSSISQRIKSVGSRDYEKFKDEVQLLATGLNLKKADGKEIFQHILHGTTPTDPRLAQGMEFAQKHFEDMYFEEMDMGIRRKGKAQAPNYVYPYYKPNKNTRKGEIPKFKKIISDYVDKNGTLPPDLIERAKAAGFSLEEDVFRSLLLRKLESNRIKTRLLFAEDLVDNFAVKAKNLSKEAIRDRNLVDFTERIPKNSQFYQQLIKDGGKWYLPKDISQSYDDFVKLLSSNPEEATQQFLRTLDNLTRMFKASATVPYPGFHIRNALGDIFMSTLDGVKSSDYSEVFRWGRAKSKGEKTVKIGSESFTFEQLKALFNQYAASGTFHSTELTDTGTDVLTNLNPNKIWDNVRELSQNREDFFRFTHFYSAFKGELPKYLTKGANKEKAIAKAAEASTYRVNKYLFDYGALTHLEKNGLRRLIPFYTYARKVMPTLVEAAFLNPSRMSKVNRIFFQDQSNENFDDMLIPEYQREIGYAKLIKGDQPWLLGGQFLPTEVLRSNTDVSDVPAFFQNLISQFNPAAKIPIELAAEKSMFNDREIEPNAQYLGGALAPPQQPLNEFLGTIPGANSVIDAIPGMEPSNKGFLERILSGRIGAGLPISPVTNAEQTSSVYNLKEQIESQLESVNFNLADRGLKVYLSPRKDGASFRIRNIATDEVVAEAESLDEILRLLGNM